MWYRVTNRKKSPRILHRLAAAAVVSIAVGAIDTTGPRPHMGGSGLHAQSGASTIVLWTANTAAADRHGDWTRVTDATAAGGAAVYNPNRSRGRVSPALAAPED